MKNGVFIYISLRFHHQFLITYVVYRKTMIIINNLSNFNRFIQSVEQKMIEIVWNVYFLVIRGKYKKFQLKRVKNH